MMMNIIYAEPLRGKISERSINPSTDQSVIRNYLTDESSTFMGFAEKVYFPQNEREIAQILKYADMKKIPVTISGAGTSITGSRVPFGGVILSTEKLIDVSSCAEKERTDFVDPDSGLRYTLCFGKDPETKLNYVIAPPGITIQVLKKAVNSKGLDFPPDTTEMTAFLGGTVATNASGASTFHYGSTRRWIRRLRVVLANGEVLDIRRKRVFADEKDQFVILMTSGERVTIQLPSYIMPRVKNAAGYFVEKGMDLIDLFIGSEGTLGVISEVEAQLIDKINRTSCVAFFPKIRDSLQFFKDLRGLSKESSSKVLFIEYFDWYSLEFMREKHPTIPPKAKGAIYFEQEESEDLLKRVVELLDKHNCLDSWAALPGFGKEIQERLREFRHSLPEAVNDFVRRRGTNKMGLDLVVPYERFDEMMDSYIEVGTEVLINRIFDALKLPFEDDIWKGMSLEEKLRAIEDAVDVSAIPQEIWDDCGVVRHEYYTSPLRDRAEILRRDLGVDIPYVNFGHIGDCHLHFNFLPQTKEEIPELRKAYLRLARKAVQLGGTISGEHGVGKKTFEENGVKRPYLELLYDQKELGEIALLKHKLDPNHILNIGNVIPKEYIDNLQG